MAHSNSAVARSFMECIFQVSKTFFYSELHLRFPVWVCVSRIQAFDEDLENVDSAVWPDWAIYCTLDNFSKPVASIILKNCPHLEAIIAKVSKSFIFLVESFWATFVNIWQQTDSAQVLICEKVFAMSVQAQPCFSI